MLFSYYYYIYSLLSFLKPTCQLLFLLAADSRTKMLAIDDVLCELTGDDCNDQGLPPGFRFHPTDEELITFYLASKVFHGAFSAGAGVDIAEVDLNRCEPWELPEGAKMGEREWYFFSLRDRKYPTGLRTNRATGAGYWKATGKDKEVYSSSNSSNNNGGHLLGLKKTLVFYKGRAPRGEKTKWVMHEYRLHGDFSYRHTCKEEWVICRIFHKAGDKKHHLPLQHSYLMEPSSSPTTATATTTTTASLPPLLETTTQINQNYPFEIHQENDLLIKTLMNNNSSLQSQSQTNNQLFSLVNGFQQQKQEPSFSPSNTNPSQSMLFKSLLSHQDSIWGGLKEQISNNTGMPKQCKTEANFSNYIHLPDAATMQHWLDKIYPDPYQNQPLLFHNTDGSSSCTPLPPTAHSFGFSAATIADQTVHHEMSTSSPATAGFHMMLDF